MIYYYFLAKDIMSFEIKIPHSRQVRNSRGNLAVEVEIYLSDDTVDQAVLPPDVSTGDN